MSACFLVSNPVPCARVRGGPCGVLCEQTRAGRGHYRRSVLSRPRHSSLQRFVFRSYSKSILGMKVTPFARSDFKTNEYAKLLGGALFEPKEENPMLVK